MKTTPRANQLRNKAAIALAASRNADSAADRDNLLTKAKGLEMLAVADEWLDDAPADPAGRSRTG